MGHRKRWCAHVKRAMSTERRHPLLDSIRKYGGDAFTLSVLSTHPDKHSAQEAEVFWIHTLSPALNLSPGGEADGETGSTLFWAEMATNPEKRAEYLKSLSAGCVARHQSRPELNAALALRALEWRAENPREAYYQSYRAIRTARKAQGHRRRDPRFAKCGRLWIPSPRVGAARKSYKGKKSLRNQWASRDQTQRKKSIAVAATARWAGLSEVEREAHLAKLAAARKNVVHSEEVKERRREGIRRYWAEKRVEKQLSTL